MNGIVIVNVKVGDAWALNEVTQVHRFVKLMQILKKFLNYSVWFICVI